RRHSTEGRGSILVARTSEATCGIGLTAPQAPDIASLIRSTGYTQLGRATPCKRQNLSLQHWPVIRSESTMFDAAFKALAQMFTPPFRSVLLKSAGLALALLALMVIALSRLLAWLTSAGEHWAEGALGAIAHDPLRIVGWLVAFALGSGLVAGAVVLMPAVTALVASFFTDEIAEKVEQSHYPLDPPGV